MKKINLQKTKIRPLFEFVFIVFRFLILTTKTEKALLFRFFVLNQKGKNEKTTVFPFWFNNEKRIILWYPDRKHMFTLSKQLLHTTKMYMYKNKIKIEVMFSLYKERCAIKKYFYLKRMCFQCCNKEKNRPIYIQVAKKLN